MLVAVIMIFLVMSFTGVAVLDISHNSSSAAQETTFNIKNQYALESSVNHSMWLINNSADSAVTRVNGNVATSWDSLTQILTVNVDTLGVETEVDVHLNDDFHFERGIATALGLNKNGYSLAHSEQHATRNFDFMPDVDITFFADNAISTNNGNENSFKGDDFTVEGIYVFNGNNLTLDSLDFSASTLVFAGKFITITNSNITSLPGNEYIDAFPALVFTNPDAQITIQNSNVINGAIYAAGTLNLYDASMTGPIVGSEVNLYADIDLNDENADDYYAWTAGFGDATDYDWPKHIEKWVTKQWARGTNG
jgi:hypothetical protein